MKKEHVLITIVGLILLSYLIDAVVNPLDTILSTPYQFFTSDNFSTFPLTSVSIVLKAVGITLIPLWILSFFGARSATKGVLLIIISALLQLYAVQDIASSSYVVPLEWSLGFTLAGIILLIPAITLFIIGIFENPHKPTEEDLKLHTPDEHLKKLEK